MTVFSIILGVLLIFAGFSAMFTPVATFLSAGYLLAIVMFVYGLMGIIKAFKKQSNVWQTIVSVLAVIVGILAMARPGRTLVLDVMILYAVAGFFLIRGIFAVVMAFKLKDVNKGWVLGLILGILSAILGVYSLLHPGVAAITTGFLIGFYFIETGIDMIVVATALKKADKTVDKE